jgi:hypothetical protein
VVPGWEVFDDNGAGYGGAGLKRAAGNDGKTAVIEAAWCPAIHMMTCSWDRTGKEENEWNARFRSHENNLAK